MNITEKRKFYERVYFYELDKREQIYVRLRLPIAILTFMVPINFFLVTEVLEWKRFMTFGMSEVFTFISLFILSISVVLYS